MDGESFVGGVGGGVPLGIGGVDGGVPSGRGGATPKDEEPGGSGGWNWKPSDLI